MGKYSAIISHKPSIHTHTHTHTMHSFRVAKYFAMKTYETLAGGFGAAIFGLVLVLKGPNFTATRFLGEMKKRKRGRGRGRESAEPLQSWLHANE